MGEIMVHLENCNCIKKADIKIQEGTLNIKYGTNGTGKSTISKAVSLKAQGDEEKLQSLRPYMANDSEKTIVNGLNFNKVMVFNEEYVNSYLFEDDSFLENTARRAGWVGCNIVLKQIPEEGRIFIVKNEIEIPQKEIISKVKRTDFIKQYKLDARGWVLDVLNCVNQIEGRDFTLEQMYKFEDVLSKKHPDNNHIKDKIRQKLQILRDKGILEFRGRGHYRKI